MWLINLAGLLLIGATIWWFWLYKPKDFVSASDGTITIVVQDGVYQPALIRLPINQPSTLRFIRKDKTPCAATVLFDDFDVSAELPLNQPVDIVLTPDKPGTFDFNCQMKMYKGQLQVTEQSR